MKVVIIKNEHFKNSNGFNSRNCPLQVALKEIDGEDYGVSLIYVGSYSGRESLSGFEMLMLDLKRLVYKIPFKIWNSSVVDPLISRAKEGEIVPDFELELEELV